ncbi:hypothetical protein GSbR_30490 [Geobacter sp. SVR]|nr:hypothetical protein GSVR_30510 [Geobacter sp. SVR]GCF86449.1 hypothetical protein GSbR_30490 [Geobacter sp. SVR]
MCPKCAKSRKAAKNNEINIEAPPELSSDEKALLNLFRLNPLRVQSALEAALLSRDR